MRYKIPNLLQLNPLDWYYSVSIPMLLLQILVKTDSYDLSMELLPQRDELKSVSTTHGGLCATTFGTIGPPVWSAINLAYHRHVSKSIIIM